MGTAISARPAVTSVAGVDLMVVVQSGTTSKITVTEFNQSVLRRFTSAGTAAAPGLAVGAGTVGLASTGSGATEALILAANGTEIARLGADARVKINNTANWHATAGRNAALAVVSTVTNGNSISVADNHTASTTKSGRIVSVPYALTDNPVGLILALNAAATNQVDIGGGSSILTAATSVTMWAAAAVNTATGTAMLRLTTTGIKIQSGASTAASDLLHVLTTGGSDILRCQDTAQSVGMCGAASPAGTRACAIGSSATAAGTDAYAIGNGASASSNYAYAFGLGATANASYSTAIGGRSTARSVSGRVSFSACAEPINSSAGTTQIGMLNVARETTDATPTVLCSNSSAAAATNQLALPNNSAYYVTGRVVATKTGAGDSSCWDIKVLIKRGANAASTTLESTADVTMVKQAAGAAAWAVAATADTTNGALAITVTGQAATTIRWNCFLNPVEVTF